MPTAKQTIKILARPMPAFIVLAVIYLSLIFILPVNQPTLRHYNLNNEAYRVLLFLFALPTIATWLIAFFGYAKLREYSDSIKRTSEGQHFSKLATGCTWLAWSLPIPAIIGLILGAMANTWAGFQSGAIIVTNYSYLIIPLIGFTLIGAASRGLIADSKLQLSLNSSRTIMLFFAFAGTIYCYLTFHQFDLASPGSTDNAFYLPLWLTLITLTIPYLYAWFVGLLASYEISLFSKNVRGLLYRQSLQMLVGGLVAVIASSIALQYINGVLPRTNELILDYRVPLVMAFRLLSGIGFGLIAFGAIRLKKIEEV